MRRGVAGEPHRRTSRLPERRLRGSRMPLLMAKIMSSRYVLGGLLWFTSGSPCGTSPCRTKLIDPVRRDVRQPAHVS